MNLDNKYLFDLFFINWINYSDSCCEQLQLQLTKLQTDLTVSQSSPEEITAEKQQKDEDLETLQDEFNSALSRQTVLKKKMRRLKAVSNSALKKLEEEKDQLTNQVTEVQTLLWICMLQVKLCYTGWQWKIMNYSFIKLLYYKKGACYNLCWIYLLLNFGTIFPFNFANNNPCHHSNHPSKPICSVIIFCLIYIAMRHEHYAWRILAHY